MRHLALTIVLLAAAGVAQAQIVANGLGTSVNAPAGAVTISGGTSVGNNVFHSFSTFNVATGDSATFTGAGTVTNIIARVTGGASSIDGTLRTAAGANTSLWILNPAGVAFGQNASLDVTGSFHASTAHALKFGASGQFDMAGAPAGTLSVSPTAFVFLSPPAAITVDGATLAVPSGRNLSLVGGNIGIANGTIHVPSGQLGLASVAGAGEVTLGAGSLAATGTAASSQITLTNASLDTWSTPGAPGPASGSIFIRGGKLSVNQSTVSTEHTGGAAGGGIDIALAGDLAMNGGLLLATGLGTGAAGSISVDATGVSMASGSVIDTSGLDVSTFAGGQSGTTLVNASGDLSLSGGSQITSVTMTGTGGDVVVNAGNLSVSGAGSMINVVTVGTGTGGDITVNAVNVGLSAGGRISAGNEIVGAIGPSTGNGGSIAVNAVGSVAIGGAGSGIFSSNPAFGNAGSISVMAGSAITLAGGGQISTETLVGSGGQITLMATDLVALDHSRITTSVADGSGNGGAIFIDPAFVTLNASQIIADTFNGLGGQIDVITGNLVMDATSLIRAEAFGPFGVPGTVTVSAPNVDAGSALGVLAAAYVDPSALLRESCAARGARAGSSFIGAGRGALPAGPDSAGFARYAFGPAPAVLASSTTPRMSASVLQGCS